MYYFLKNCYIKFSLRHVFLVKILHLLLSEKTATFTKALSTVSYNDILSIT